MRWGNLLLEKTNSLKIIEKLAQSINLSVNEENQYGFDFTKYDIDQNIDKLISVTMNKNSTYLEVLSSIIMHHGANFPDYYKNRVLVKTKNKRLKEDLLKYQSCHPIPQLVESYQEDILLEDQNYMSTVF